MKKKKIKRVMKLWKDKTMNIRITNMFLYSKIHKKKGVILLVAVDVECDELLELRKGVQT